MSKSEEKREKWLGPMAAHVLQHGMSGASLRPLAKAAGTSDRMLIYHFGNKEALIAELLTHIADTYSAMLDQAFGDERARSRRDFVERILEKTGQPMMQPFLALWWDIVSDAAHGKADHRDAAQAMMDQLLGWMEEHMPDGDPDPAGGARYLLTLIEGTLMFRAIGHEQIALEGLAASEL